MKKIILLSLLLTVQAAQATHYYTGFYGSLGVGGTIAAFSVIQDPETIPNDPTQGQFNLPSDLEMQDSNAMGMIAIGYSHQFDYPIVLGAEFTASITDAKASHLNELFIPPPMGGMIAGSVETQYMNDFALLFKPGYIFKERTQLYLVTGPRWGNFKTSVETNVDLGHGVTQSGSDQHQGYEFGWTAGIGLEHMVTHHLSVGLEYAYTNYGSINSPENILVTPGGTNGVTVLDNPNISSYINTVMLDFSYHF